MRRFVLIVVAAAFSACDVDGASPTREAAPPVETSPARWYTDDQVASGKILYAEHCASCHGANAEATPDWRKRDASGHYPPPPLNGSAHAWHHSLAVLENTIAEGGAAMDGVMPGFGEVLDYEQRLAVIAYFQQFWSDEIYGRWREIDGR